MELFLDSYDTTLQYQTHDFQLNLHIAILK